MSAATASRTLNFSGVFTALVTPFLPSGEVDYESFGRLVESQIEAGITGLVPVWILAYVKHIARGSAANYPIAAVRDDG
jgi:hypothetical protein